MKYIILGQPRNGKSTLAKMISEEKHIPVICTDDYRRDWGFHEPWKGYDTEINPLRQKEFYDKLLELYNQYDNVILEGSSINPKDINIFDYDSVVLLYKRDISPNEMLSLSRKYDNDWTTKREDGYLLDLFKNYLDYSKKWVQENPDIAIDTSNYKEGLEIAKKKLYSSSIKNGSFPNE